MRKSSFLLASARPVHPHMRFGMKLAILVSTHVVTGDYHAGKVETSLMLYWAPEKVRRKIVMDSPELTKLMREDLDLYQVLEKDTRSQYEIPRTRQHRQIKVGVMGYPEKATAALGKRICQKVVIGMVAELKRISRQTASSREGYSRL